jgi:GNAT superfamily N-acetyltransferase
MFSINVETIPVGHCTDTQHNISEDIKCSMGWNLGDPKKLRHHTVHLHARIQPCVNDSDVTTVVGTAQFHPMTARLRQVCVRREFQGRGVGKALVSATRDVAVALGFKFVTVLPDTNAKLFYEKQGFSMDATETRNRDWPTMRLDITVPSTQFNGAQFIGDVSNYSK